ncbi:MAG: indole acetimide hydrolase, partial [Actinobacteria bacterium]
GMVPSFMSGPMADGPASFQLMPVEGPMGRRMADVRLAFGLLAGRDPRDPYSVPVPVGSPRDSNRPLRVAVLASPPGGSTDPRVADRVRAAADALANSGYEVTEDGPPRFEDAAKTWFDFIGEDIRFMGPMITPIMSDTANAFLGALLDSIPPVDLAGYNQILMTRQALMREWGMWFTNTDLVLTPTWTQIPFEHGWDAPNALATIEMMRCVTIANLLGLPSACVPAGLVDGVPVGVLLTGDRFADDKTMDAAEVVEAALGLPTPIDPLT